MASVFGVITSAGDLGLLQSFNGTHISDMAESKDEKGATKEVEFYNETKECTIEYTLKSGATIPDPGDTVMLTGGNFAGKYLCLSNAESQSNGDFSKLTQTVKRWVDNLIPAQT